MSGNLNLQTTVNGSVPYKIANIQPKVFMLINRHADVTLDEFLQRCTIQNFRFEVCERDVKNTLGIQYGLILIHKFCLIFLFAQRIMQGFARELQWRCVQKCIKSSSCESVILVRFYPKSSCTTTLVKDSYVKVRKDFETIL